VAASFIGYPVAGVFGASSENKPASVNWQALQQSQPSGELIA
jgi:hypothetical protein